MRFVEYICVYPQRVVYLVIINHKQLEIMETQLQNIIDLASRLVINGKATIETALEMAINIDNDRCLKVIEDIQDMRSGYINERNINQKGFEIIKESVYLKLSKS